MGNVRLMQHDKYELVSNIVSVLNDDVSSLCDSSHEIRHLNRRDPQLSWTNAVMVFDSLDESSNHHITDLIMNVVIIRGNLHMQ